MAQDTAFGFVGLQDLYDQRVQDAGPERIWDAVDQSAAFHTRFINEMMGALVERTTVAQEQIELPSSGMLQPIDEDGSPLPTKSAASYQVAYPIFGGGDAWGDNRISRAMMTVREANRHTVDAQNKDAAWLREHMLGAILNNAAWTYLDKAGVGNGYKGLGNITIQPLANGDTIKYLKRDGTLATDNHYLFQAGGIADATNPFPTIRAELTEHPSNTGPVVAFVASNLTSDIEALADFVDEGDPDVEPGSGSAQLVGSITRGFGDEVLGKVSRVWIVEWSALPSDYIVALSAGAGAFLKMREYGAPELQGFFPERFNVDGNHQVTRMLRFAGFGVGNRLAACVMQVGAGAYAIPTGYSQPMQVL